MKKKNCLFLLLMIAQASQVCAVSWSDVTSRLELVKKRLQDLTPAQAAIAGAAVTASAILARQYFAQKSFVDAEVQTDLPVNAEVQIIRDELGQIESLVHQQQGDPSQAMAIVDSLENSLEGILPVGLLDEVDDVPALPAAAAVSSSSSFSDTPLRQAMNGSIFPQQNESGAAPAASDQDEEKVDDSALSERAQLLQSLHDAINTQQYSSKHPRVLGLDGSCNADGSHDLFREYGMLGRLDIDVHKAIIDGARLVSHLEKGESVDFDSQSAYLNAIIHAIWYFYAQATSRGEAHEEGTFVLHGDLAHQVFAFLKNYVDRFAGAWSGMVPSMGLSTSGMTWPEAFAYNTWHAAQKSWLALNGKSVQDWPTFNMFVQKGRDSSHFTHTKSFVDEAMMHYGIDIVYGSEQSPLFTKLPTVKSHILFGQSRDMNGRPITFIKIENHGLYRLLSSAGHLKEFAVSQGGKRLCSNYYEAPMAWRKERAPESLIALFARIIPALSQDEVRQLKTYGLQFAVRKARESRDNLLSQAFVDLVSAIFNHENTRFGAEVSINADDLVDLSYYQRGLTEQQYQFLADVILLKRDIAHVIALKKLQKAMSVLATCVNEDIRQAYQKVIKIYSPWLVHQGLLTPVTFEAVSPDVYLPQTEELLGRVAMLQARAKDSEFQRLDAMQRLLPLLEDLVRA